MITTPRVIHPVMDRAVLPREKKHRLTRLMRPGQVRAGRETGGLRCRCFETGDGTRHCYSTGPNVAGTYLVWVEVEVQGQLHVTEWAGAKTRNKARRLARRRAQRGRGDAREIPEVRRMPQEFGE